MAESPDQPERRTISMDDEARPSPLFVAREEEPTPAPELTLPLPGLTPAPPLLEDTSYQTPAPAPESTLPPPGPTPAPPPREDTSGQIPSSESMLPRAAELPALPFHQDMAETAAEDAGSAELPSVEFDDTAPPRARPVVRTRRLPAISGEELMLPRKRLRDRIWLPSPTTALLTLVIAAGVYVQRNWNRELDVTSEHRAMVVTAARLSTYLEEEVWVAGMEGFDVEPRAESIEVRRRLGGMLRVAYEYRGRGAGQPTLEVEVALHPSPSAARAALRAIEIRGVVERGGLGEGILERVDLGKDCHWGDQSSASLVLVDSDPVGHDFRARDGSTTIRVMLRGVAFRDGWELQQLLAPTLEALAARE